MKELSFFDRLERIQSFNSMPSFLSLFFFLGGGGVGSLWHTEGYFRIHLLLLCLNLMMEVNIYI